MDFFIAKSTRKTRQAARAGGYRDGEKQSCQTDEREKLTYRRLAELSGVAGETINRARGTLIYECKLSTLDALAKVLDVNIKDLFDED
ncbi:helix-turn-helix transcriptional regulator [uncultured Bilophila sp.]|uniref:helix-turn-helix domain-containing protein n=1 Tax=uncultured Bilophila sp. TaxID=529385 RepID=UPI00339071B3